MNTFLIYMSILFSGIITAYVVDFYLIKKHHRESLSMIDRMFSDAKKSMMVLITILTFGFINFKDEDENN